MEIFKVLQNFVGVSLNLLEVRWSRTILSAYTFRQPYESIFTSDLPHLTLTDSY